jgi:hypothetical protein
LRDKLYENQVEEKVYVRVLEELEIEPQELDFADKFTNPETDGSLFSDSWS